MIINKDSFAKLYGLQLSSVEFVQGYFQLRFDGPCMTVYNPTRVESGNIKAKSWDNQFRNVLCRQISKIVREIKFFEKDSLIIEFEDKSRVIISLKDEDYKGPEAINYRWDKADYLVVI